MKILAIRGKNLASLAEEFELRFDQQPLISTGLFAICGPTGAGKSTLLDALCLALYNNTPRLAKASMRGVNLPDVGAETITPRDPGNLLRRGAGQGYAEVDFLGNDGLEYCARWEVRRARGKTTGKLQNVERTLLRRQDQQALGNLKTEVQREMEQRLGLSFEQFTRAVLLAQNEFATFLKAEDDERAALLETLTGLDTYTHLSIRAHERAKRENNALEALQRRLGDQPPLSPEVRVQWEQALNAARAQATLLNHRKAELDQHLRWHQRWEELQQAVIQAGEVLQNTRSTQQAATLRQIYFRQVEAIQDVRPLWVECQRLSKLIVTQQQAVTLATERLAAAQHTQQQADIAFTVAAAAVASAEAANAAAIPALERAKTLDAEIKALTPGHATATQAHDAARQNAAAAAQQLADKRAQQEQTHKAEQAAQNWLRGHQHWQRLAEEWPRWDTLFTQAAEAQDALQQSTGLIATHRQAAAQQEQARDQATATLNQTMAALQTAENTLQATTEALTAFDREKLSSRRIRIDHYREQLDSAEKIWTTLANTLARQQELTRETAGAEARITTAEDELARLLLAKAPASARLDQAEQALKLAEMACARNVETLREQLQTSVPCPVCGATEHPYAQGEAPSRALLASLKSQAEACRKTVTDLDRQEAAAQANRDNNHQRVVELANEQQALRVAIQHHTESWNAHSLATKLEPVPPTDRPAWFAEQHQIVRKHQTKLSKDETAYAHAIQANTAAQTIHKEVHTSQTAARETLTAVQIQFERTTQTLQTAIDRQQEIANRLEAFVLELNAAHGDHRWQTAWRANPAAHQRQQRQQAEQWRNQHQTSEQLANQRTGLELEIANLAANATEKAAHLHRTAADFATIDQTLVEKRQQRQDLWQGRPVAEVAADFAATIADAKHQHQRQDDARQKAATAQTSAKTVHHQAQAALADSQQAAEQAHAALADWLAHFNAAYPAEAALDVNALPDLLAHDSGWIAQERQALQQLSDAVRDAETTLRERQAWQKEHESQRASPDSIALLQAASANITTELETVNRQATEAELQLGQDDERRRYHLALQNQIAEQEAKTVIWQKLDSLIGSADGKKFRNYAQGFTLEILLGYANRHLRDLTRRYRLERVSDSLALMVVDQDMGDECRSVHSLSGGESFLVSLALALGLASLSSSRVRVESLFIDEGFGSLDADTLQVAMDALDKLQAQGRKVGVISHVQEMTERIGVQIQIRRQTGGQSRIEIKHF